MSTKKSYSERILMIEKYAARSSNPEKVKQVLSYWDKIASFKAEDQRKIKEMINKLYNALPKEPTKQEKKQKDNDVMTSIEKLQESGMSYMAAKRQVMKEKAAEEQAETEKQLKEIAERAEARLKRIHPTGKTDLKRDASRSAKEPGKRTSADGSVYYENRRNRTDLDHDGQYPHL